MQGKISKILTICPRCNGTGHARSYNKQPKYSFAIQKKARKLYESGMSLREIANILHLHHPQTVKNIIK
jgi:transposase-like protein